MSNLKTEIVDDLQKIKELIPDYINLLNRVDEGKNLTQLIIINVDVRKMKLSMENHLDIALKNQNHAPQ